MGIASAARPASGPAVAAAAGGAPPRHIRHPRTPHPMSEHRQRRTGFSTAGSTSNTPWSAKIRHHREHGGMYSGALCVAARENRRVICTGFELPGYPATPEPLPD